MYVLFGVSGLFSSRLWLLLCSKSIDGLIVCEILILQLLETMVKNCGDYVHFQIAEKKILEEMIKIVKKKVSLIFVQ